MFPSLTKASTPIAHAPSRVSGATWQAGITPRNSRYKVLLNGEPQPLAFAASVKAGWVKVYRVRDEGADESKRAFNAVRGEETLYGHVEVIPGDRN